MTRSATEIDQSQLKEPEASTLPQNLGHDCNRKKIIFVGQRGSNLTTSVTYLDVVSGEGAVFPGKQNLLNGIRRVRADLVPLGRAETWSGDKMKQLEMCP